VKLDVQTTFIFSAFLTATISLSILFYSLSKKENRNFIWLSAASGFLTISFIFFSLRGQIPDFLSIIVSNELFLFCLVAFYEVFRNFLFVRLKTDILGPSLLILQLFLLIWYTYFNPNFHIRVIIVNLSLIIMSLRIIKLILSKSLNKQRSFRIFAVIPFILIFFISMTQIMFYFFEKTLPENLLSSPSYAFSIVLYGILVVWISFSIVFISANELQNQLSKFALTDSLTGTLNRRALKEAVEREIARAKRNHSSLSLIITDLDHFKKVNDRYGHQAGDAVLTHTVESYRGLLRTEDLLARYGGEEFVIVLPGVDVKIAFSIAERLRIACEKNIMLFENQPIPVTSSFGVTGFFKETIGYETLVKQADGALYRAKTEGRNRVILFENKEINF